MSTKVLIVDDSALMRKKIAELISARGKFEVEFAKNGIEAIALNKSFCPDVITLDINMPEMDGLTALAQMMLERPVPVLMVSSLTEKGALATFEALALGAVDFIAKPDGTISLSIEKIGDELVEKIQSLAGTKNMRGQNSRVNATREAVSTRTNSAVTSANSRTAPLVTLSKPKAVLPHPPTDAPEGLVLVGVSTGGPSTLEVILRNIEADFPFPILIAQHMPTAFTGPFAQRMNNLCRLQVVEVNQPLLIKKGVVYIAKGGGDMVVSMRGGNLYAVPKPESSQHHWHPSVELLGSSALEHCNAEHLIGVILTGMGNDGAKSFADIRRLGGKTIAESEASAVVFGMPKELIDAGGASSILPVEKIAPQLHKWATAMGENNGFN